MSDIITAATLKPYLGIAADDTAHDTVLAIIISGVSEAIQNELGRPLIEDEYEDLALDGSGRSFLYLPYWPVSELTEITEDGATLTEGEDDDFRLYTEDGVLVKYSGIWSKGLKNVIVTMTAGYTIANIPKDLQFMAMNKIAREWKKQRGQLWGEDSRTFPDGSVQSVRLDDHLLDGELKILQKYKRKYI